MLLRIFITATIFASSVCARAESFEFNQSGTLKVDTAAQRSAQLHVACSPDSDGGALTIELMVPEANTRKDFDYEDFEGPDAPAGGKALSHLAWTSAAGTTDITHAATGWYVPDPAQAFMFGVTQMSHHREPPARLMAAVGLDAGTLTWTQSGFGKDEHKLVATFMFDAAATQKAHAAVVRCLPINSPRKPPN